MVEQGLLSEIEFAMHRAKMIEGFRREAAGDKGSGSSADELNYIATPRPAGAKDATNPRAGAMFFRALGRISKKT